MLIFALSTLALSLLLMAAMIYFKSVEIQTGRRYFSFHAGSDHFLQKSRSSFQQFLQNLNWRMFSNFYHYVLTKFEGVLIKVVRYANNKFVKPVNMVKGQGEIPEAKPDPSFFLKNVEEYKNDLK